MQADPASASTSGVGVAFERAIAPRVVWLADERRDLQGASTQAPALVAVVGREHYTERRKRYPIDARRDLERVLEQEVAGQSDVLTTIGPSREGGRDVAFFELKPGTLERVGRTLFIVPETLLLANTLRAGQIAEVERAGFRYFIASSGVSQPAAGAVATPQLFGTAIGQYELGEVAAIDGPELLRRLVPGLRRVPLASWSGLRKPGTQRRLEIDWRKVGTWSALAVVAYLALASGYLKLTTQSREAELGTLGPEVNALLDAQNKVERVGTELNAIDTLLRERRDTYRLWAVVGAAWSRGAEINRLVLKDAQLTIYGTAPVATDVLSAVAAAPGVANARFSSPVRSIDVRKEEFALTLNLTAAEAQKRG